MTKEIAERGEKEPEGVAVEELTGDRRNVFTFAHVRIWSRQRHDAVARDGRASCAEKRRAAASQLAVETSCLVLEDLAMERDSR